MRFEMAPLVGRGLDLPATRVGRDTVTTRPEGETS